jgi:tetratricopeptide (TPR) repeat protein
VRPQNKCGSNEAGYYENKSNEIYITMKQEMNYSRYVDRYLEGVMNNAERIWFEKELDGNSELQKEIHLQQKLNTVIADQESIALQRQMNNIHKKIYGNIIPDLNFSRSFKNILSLATGIAAVVAISAVIIIKSMSVNTTDKIYTEYFKPADMSMSFRSSGEVFNNDLRSAMTLYDNQKYVDAIQLFEKILKEDGSRIGLNLYSGISHMEINQYSEANERFKRIIDQKANTFVESAQWYLGLCYLRTNEIDKAKEIFAGISKTGIYYKKDARSILKRMN